MSRTDNEWPAQSALRRLAPLLDAGTLLLAGYAAWWLRWNRAEVAPHYLLALLLGTLLALVIMPAVRAYRPAQWSHPLRGFIAAGPGVAMVFGSLMLIGTATQTTADFSRIWMAAWMSLTLLGMALWRGALSPLARQPLRQILLLGSGRLADELATRLAQRQGPYHLAGRVSLPGDDLAAGSQATCLGSLDELDTVLAGAKPPIDELWLAPDRSPGPADQDLLTRLRLYSLPVRYVPNLGLLQLIGQRASEIEGMTMIELNATPLDGPDALVKALLDRTLAALALLVLSPLLLIVALWIRLDSPGPILFRQPRHGSGGRIIQVLKFRSMYHGARVDNRQATRDDPRVTRIGTFLRRSSLDELPQLINVLRGDMSLVGPRPHPVTLNEEYAKKLHAYMQRHRVLPGITGWAQVNGYRGATDTLHKMQKRLEYDLYYIEHWSLGLDLYILARTVVLGWGGANVY